LVKGRKTRAVDTLESPEDSRRGSERPENTISNRRPSSGSSWPSWGEWDLGGALPRSELTGFGLLQRQSDDPRVGSSVCGSLIDDSLLRCEEKYKTQPIDARPMIISCHHHHHHFLSFSAGISPPSRRQSPPSPFVRGTVHSSPGDSLPNFYLPILKRSSPHRIRRLPDRAAKSGPCSPFPLLRLDSNPCSCTARWNFRFQPLPNDQNQYYFFMFIHLHVKKKISAKN
jgi:hypothetical protein